MCKRKLGQFAFLGLLMAGTSLPAKAADLYLGIVPQQAASRLAQMWLPFMAELSKQTGLSIKFATMKDIPTFEKCLAQGAYDIAYMNPYHYTEFSKVSGYRAIAHQAEKKLKGLIVVRNDSPIKELKELDGQKVAFPSPAAFGASVLPRAEMKMQGMTVYPAYVKSHDSVYKSVLMGLFPAGGGVARTFNGQSDEVKSQLRVIYNTEGYTPHAFAVSKSMTDAMMKQIQDAMVKMAQTNEKAVNGVGMKGIVAADDKAWDDVRKLGLTQEETEIAEEGTVTCRFD